MTVPENPLEKRLATFAATKGKDDYVRLLYAFRYTDVLVPSALSGEAELPFGNEGHFVAAPFRPDIVYFPKTGQHLMPVFSDVKEIPADYHAGKAVFMHCADWVKAFHMKKSDGVILNPFSKLSFLLTPDQIKVLLSFPEDGAQRFFRGR